MTDEEYYRLYLQGNEGGMDHLMQKYGGPLTLYINGCLGDPQEAEDLMVEVFTYLCARKPRIREGGLQAYLYKSARHMALRHKSRRRPCFSLENLAGEPVGRLLEETVKARERSRILCVCMQRLPAQYREALYLVYFAGMSYRQTAAVMGKSLRQVTNMVYRGKKSLRRLLEKEGVTGAEL